MLQCLGDEPCHFVLIFDNGYFSEFGTFSITDWIGHTPKALLAKNFGLPAATFDGFPKSEVYFAQGSPPPANAAAPLGGAHPGPRTHKYRLLADEPRVTAKGGRLWVIDSGKFPISKTITGAILELEPGALRELHWHPTADEWQYVFEGQLSVSLFGAKGRYRTETLEAGDVGYVPQGYGHALENVGGKPCRALIGFNSGVYEDIDLSEWFAANPTDVLATNFGKPAELFERFPQDDSFITDREGRRR
jgi:oxalate decarboxylase